jgi:hypothetical protein
VRKYLALFLSRQIGAWGGGGQVKLRRIAGMLGHGSNSSGSLDRRAGAGVADSQIRRPG